MTIEKFTLSHAIHNAGSIQIQGLKIGSHRVNIDISRVHTRKVVPEVLLNENWYEHQEVFSDQIDYDWHCPETGMIFATYQEKTNGDSALTIYHNAN